METNRLAIRPLKEIDFAPLLDIYTVPINMKYILDGKSNWTLEELKEKWKTIGCKPKGQTGLQLVFLRSTNQLIGECGLLKTARPAAEELEMAYMIDQSHWGKGYGTEIAEALLRYGFEELKVEKLKAGMYKENVGSARIMEKLGMKLILEKTIKGGQEIMIYEMSKAHFIDLSIQ